MVTGYITRGFVSALGFGVLLCCGGEVGAPNEAEFTASDGSVPTSGNDASSGPDASAVGAKDASADAVTAGPTPPQADGIYSQTTLGAGVFDADCVYLLGTLQEGEAWKDALVEMSRPNDYATGFGYPIWRPFVRPTDGRVLFQSKGDHTPYRDYRFTTSAPGNPDLALAMQTVETAVTCADVLWSRFYVFPDDGAILYECNNQFFVTGSAQPLALAQGYHPIATGTNRLVVTAKLYPEIVLFENGVTTPVTGLTGTPFAFRSRSTGAVWMATSSTGVRAELREIARDGSTTVVGTYDVGPDPVSGLGGTCALEPSGALVCMGAIETAPIQVDGVTRYTFAKPPELIYDERMKPVKIHLSDLVTGP